MRATGVAIFRTAAGTIERAVVGLYAERCGDGRAYRGALAASMGTTTTKPPPRAEASVPEVAPRRRRIAARAERSLRLAAFPGHAAARGRLTDSPRPPWAELIPSARTIGGARDGRVLGVTRGHGAER